MFLTDENKDLHCQILNNKIQIKIFHSKNWSGLKFYNVLLNGSSSSVIYNKIQTRIFITFFSVGLWNTKSQWRENWGDIAFYLLFLQQIFVGTPENIPIHFVQSKASTNTWTLRSKRHHSVIKSYVCTKTVGLACFAGSINSAYKRKGSCLPKWNYPTQLERCHFTCSGGILGTCGSCNSCDGVWPKLLICCSTACKVNVSLLWSVRKIAKPEIFQMYDWQRTFLAKVLLINELSLI